MGETQIQLNLDLSRMSKDRITFIIRQFRKLGEDTKLTIPVYRELLTKFSEDYSKLLKKRIGKELENSELLAYDTIEEKEVETMVNIDKYKAKEFTDTKTITAENKPDKALKITRVDEVTINSGPRQGETAVVMELDNEWTYWPNKTSITSLAGKFGNETDAWMNKKIKLGLEKMMVRGDTSPVMFAEPV